MTSMKKAVDMYLALDAHSSIKDYQKVIKALNHVTKLDVRGKLPLPEAKKLLGKETTIKEFARVLIVNLLKRLIKK